MSLLRSVAAIASLVAAYVLAGRLGLSLAFLNPSASTIWPASGIAVAALILFGVRLWPGVFIGALLVSLSTSAPRVTAPAIAVGSTLEAIVATLLVNRFAGGRFTFQRPQNVFKFFLFAGMAAPFVSASIGVTSLLLTGSVFSEGYAAVLSTWWLGDAIGTLLIAPVVILWVKKPHLGWSRPHALEVIGYTIVLVLATLAIWGRTPAAVPQHFLGFLCVPVLLWPAFRFERREAATAVLLVATIGVWRTRLGYGPFATGDLNESFLVLQVFMGTVAVTVLLVAAVVLERQRATEWLLAAQRELADRVVERTAELSTVNESLRSEIGRREQVQQQLRRSQAELETAQALAHIGSWSWDVPANRVTWSNELFRIFGVEPQSFQINYENYLNLVPPDERAKIHEVVQSSRRTGAPFEFDHRVVRPDGSERWIHALGQVTLGPDGLVRMDGTAHDITERRVAELERRRLEQEILDISGREQQRIGQDLHDDLGQLLTGIALMTKTLERKLRARTAYEADDLTAILKLVNEAIGKTRNLARVLAPVGLEDGGFVSALQALATSAERVFGISCRLACPENLRLGNDLTGVHLYRIVQEAISNAVRHGRADRIAIKLDVEGESLHLTVRDNGTGLVPEWKERAGFGLRIMKYRAGLIDGTVDIRSANGETILSCSVPRVVAPAPQTDYGPEPADPVSTRPGPLSPGSP